ncbi:anti-sigma factor [Streptomyces sp. G-G2]|uniref:anti-sigma factor n=1 Tax=Streptomyces sp. G-G2 TaxID=3046201 RepID=UPI0024B91537|nr:anti-sigma factor [Streptomyces sp. G-G2]MDJ0382726.1 anti-sigma factor [Streptomyces sp. G-G2]
MSTDERAYDAGGADPHAATGAYVLHALDEPERAAFEAHLADCPSCVQEVRELSQTAALLGRAVAVTPPPELREAVLRRIRAEPASAAASAAAAAAAPGESSAPAGPAAGPPDRPAAAPGGARHRAPAPWARWALAACLAAAAGLGGLALWQYQSADAARETARVAQARAASLAGVLSAPDARLVTGSLTGGGATGTVVVSRDRGRAVFVASGMAAPPAGRVYQLWFADPAGSMRPAGLMDPARPDAPALLAGPVGAATGVGVTLEPAGGSPAPTSAPLVVLAFPAA